MSENKIEVWGTTEAEAVTSNAVNSWGEKCRIVRTYDYYPDEHEIHETISIQNCISIKMIGFNTYKVKDLIMNREQFHARLADYSAPVPTCEPQAERYIRSNSVRIFRERAVQYYGTNSDSFTVYTDRNFLDIPAPVVALFSK